MNAFLDRYSIPQTTSLRTGAIAKTNVKPLFHDDYRQSLGETLREKLDLVACMQLKA